MEHRHVFIYCGVTDILIFSVGCIFKLMCINIKRKGASNISDFEERGKNLDVPITRFVMNIL